MEKLDNIIKFDKTKLKAVFVNGKYYIYDKEKYTNKEYQNKYNYTKIYKITSTQTNKIYIGSTTKKYLSSRFNEHKHIYRRHTEDKTKPFCSSFDIIKFDDAIIELIELYNCNDKDEQHRREKYYIELNKEIAVNKYLNIQPINDDA